MKYIKRDLSELFNCEYGIDTVFTYRYPERNIEGNLLRDEFRGKLALMFHWKDEDACKIGDFSKLILI